MNNNDNHWTLFILIRCYCDLDFFEQITFYFIFGETSQMNKPFKLTYDC